MEIPTLATVAKQIASRDESIETRMRALFYARYHGGDEALKALEGGLIHDSVLLKHEVAYVMGQMGNKKALPILENLLRSETEHCMVRHEAAEALGAIGDASSLPILEKYAKDPSPPVAETCELALRSIRSKMDGVKTDEKVGFYLFNCVGGNSEKSSTNTFTTVDPMPAVGGASAKDVPLLRKVLLNESLPLWQRYESLFALRNVGTEDAVDAIIDAMSDEKSALFRHEVAFVLGQVQSPKAVDALVRNLANGDEHPMARHESALALGSVACNPAGDKECMARASEALAKYSADPEPIVYESCLVALENIRQETTVLA